MTNVSMAAPQFRRRPACPRAVHIIAPRPPRRLSVFSKSGNPDLAPARKTARRIALASGASRMEA